MHFRAPIFRVPWFLPVPGSAIQKLVGFGLWLGRRLRQSPPSRDDLAIGLVCLVPVTAARRGHLRRRLHGSALLPPERQADVSGASPGGGGPA